MGATCHDCGCREGEIHEFGCDVERCPFCGGQLITCNCCYEILGIDPSKEPVYSQGLSEEDFGLWFALLERRRRIPFIEYPNICVKCGKLWPEMFNVSDEEWEKYIEPNMRDEMVCRSCFDYIKKVIDGNTTAKKLK